MPETSSNNVFLLNDEDAIDEAINALNKKKFFKAYIYHPVAEEILIKFTEKIPLVAAGGGVVTNDEGKVLFIYRNDKWDLPKGKLDPGETIEECAIREVEEETGVRDLEIQNFLKTTYHIFKRHNIYKLKEVHWFAMRTSFDGKLKGQKSEGIEKVKWRGPKKIKELLRNSYINIKILFDE